MDMDLKKITREGDEAVNDIIERAIEQRISQVRVQARVKDGGLIVAAYQSPNHRFMGYYGSENVGVLLQSLLYGIEHSDVTRHMIDNPPKDPSALRTHKPYWVPTVSIPVERLQELVTRLGVNKEYKAAVEARDAARAEAQKGLDVIKEKLQGIFPDAKVVGVKVTEEKEHYTHASVEISLRSPRYFPSYQAEVLQELFGWKRKQMQKCNREVLSVSERIAETFGMVPVQDNGWYIDTSHKGGDTITIRIISEERVDFFLKNVAEAAASKRSSHRPGFDPKGNSAEGISVPNEP